MMQTHDMNDGQQGFEPIDLDYGYDDDYADDYYDDYYDDDDYADDEFNDDYRAGYHAGFSEGYAQGLRHNSIAGRWNTFAWLIEARIPYKIRNAIWRFRKRFQPGFDGIPF